VTPLVSILIPAYQAAPWIAATLESALAQDHPSVEVIVVDDGSTDDTLARARAFESRGVHVIHQPNAGASAARNHAFRLSRGEFIQFLDADDLLSPSKISAQLTLLARHPRDTLAICRWGRFHDDPARTVFADDDLARDFTPIEWMRLHCAAGRMMHPAAWLVPRTLAAQAGPWDERISVNDDGEYFARVVLASPGFVCAPPPAAEAYYRSGLPGSLSKSRSPAALASVYLSVSLIASAVARADDSPPVRQALADYWQRLHLELILDAPALSAAAAEHARSLGSSRLRAGGGLAFRLLTRVIGLRRALLFRRTLAARR
jgi:glycosyltransferase involved in cell wall biosynthesis